MRSCAIRIRCWVSYSNGFCFRNMIPCSFDYLIYPYYPAYTMGCYQFVISGDNRGSGLLFVLLVCDFYDSTKGGEMQLHSPPFVLLLFALIYLFFLISLIIQQVHSTIIRQINSPVNPTARIAKPSPTKGKKLSIAPAYHNRK